MKQQSKRRTPTRGRADLDRLSRISDKAVRDSSPPELSGLPHALWDSAELVEPVRKQAVSLRIDEDVSAAQLHECAIERAGSSLSPP